jgi:hypothetical protein
MNQAIPALGCGLLGVFPDKAAYEVVRISILKNLFVYRALSFDQLGFLVEGRLRRNLGGCVGEYYTAVMQELEARGEIRRVPYSDPALFELNAD